MSEFAATLEGLVERAVVDRTEVSGSFDFDFTYASSPGDSGTANNGASLPTALIEQLGLKLESRRREPVNVLVIDHVDRPTPN
jgi:uncharacterized protein (TIGR03435 family)